MYQKLKAMYLRLINIILLVLISFKLSSQTIEIDFPSCQYLQYYFALKHGTRLDTIAQGRINEDGKATFDIPDNYSTYRGVGTLSIPFGKQNINIILNGEDKIIINEVPNSNDWLFKESNENIYLLDILAKQGRLINEYNSLVTNQTINPYTLSLSRQDIFAKNEEYKAFRQTIKESPLYAARVLEILDCISGISESFNLTQEQIIEEQKQFIIEKLNFKDLYTSGFWQLMLETYYQTFSTDDTLLLNSTKLILDKTEDIIVRRELTQSIILLFSKYGKDNLLMELGSEYLTIPISGKPAPELVTASIPIQPKSCLIFFYDSDCGMCHYQMRQLIDKYSFLNNDHNQIEVISVAADMDKNQFEETASIMPWKDKLCDLKGFAGENFKNYGIVGTPTMILIDKEGIIRGRYMRLNEFLKD